MKKRNNGGQAFPTTDRTDVIKGMTLRDYFAGQALVGILAGKYGEVQDSLSDKSYKCAVGRVSYEFADAMLKARERGRDEERNNRN